jgi:hypothetical protein
MKKWLLKIFSLSADAKADTKPEVKTLDQARGIISALQAGAQKIGAMFDSAGLDLDAHLESGEGALKDSLAAAEAKGKAELATANARITSLEADLVAQQAEATTFKADRDTAKASVTNLSAKVSLFESSLAAAGVKLPADKPLDQATITTALDGRISTKAREKLAAHGHNDPLPVEASAEPTKAKASSKTLTYAEFSALKPHEKMEFSTTGGRIV